jgi:hypothetical protein
MEANMQINQVLKILLGALFLIATNLQAQNIKSTELMYLGEEINSLTQIVESHRNTSDSLKPYMWTSIRQSIAEVSAQYRIASIEMAIVEKKLNLDLRQYRFGNKHANQNNLEEAQTATLLAWLMTKTLIKSYKTLEDGVPPLILIRERLEEVADKLQPYAQTIVNQIEAKRNK